MSAPQIFRAAKLMNIAAFASVATSATLLILKIGAFWMTGSIAVLAALADSATDLFTSLVNLFAVRHALTPADEDHRFGHAKAEPLAGLLQAAFIAGSATFLVFESVDHMISPLPVQNEIIGIAVMAISVLATIGLVIFQRFVVHRTRSLAIAADNMHYFGDLLTNLGVMLGLIFAVNFGWRIADPLIGLAVAAVLSWSAWKVFHQSYDQLMDRELPDAARERIKAIALKHPEVRGIHDLRTRAAGTLTFIQCHIEMDPGIGLSRAHEVSDDVEKALMDTFPGAEIIIHQDPAGAEIIPPLRQR
jgi:ferrous-iron efflux pump FieF